MSWHLGVAYFFGGAFIANAIPHVVAGTSGRVCPTPFASPPFRGMSSPAVNVAWGLFNLALAYLLLLHVGEFDIRSWLHVAVCFAGFGAMAFQCARAFVKIHEERRSKSSPPPAITS